MMLLLLVLPLVRAPPSSAAAAVVIEAQPRPGGLLAAQARARELIARRPSTDVHVLVLPGRHLLHAGPLLLGPQDSGEAGRFQVVWSATAPNTSFFDGGVEVPGPWSAATPPSSSSSAAAAAATTATTNLWRAPLPDSLHGKPVRQLYVDGARYRRTRVPASALGAPAGAKLVEEGFEVSSAAPVQWRDPTTVELVSDHTWVQHRCPVTAVSSVPVPPPQPPGPAANCFWGPKTVGHSPGAFFNVSKATTYEDCQRQCCEALPQCQAIIFNEHCHLLARKFEGHYSSSGAAGGFVADLNCTTQPGPLVCPALPPPPAMRSRIHVSAACWQKATQKVGGLGPSNRISPVTLSFFENTGDFNLSQCGEFYIDQKQGHILVSSDRAPSHVVVGLTQTIMQAAGAHDIVWANLSFAHSGWGSPSERGIVERYGGTLFKLPPFHGNALVPSPAAVMIANASRVQFRGCSFSHLGAWGLRLFNATQHASVSRCTFDDLSGGGICLGNVDDSGETRPRFQMASITVEDNILTDVGREYKGSPAIHSFCMRQSSVSHNFVRGVPYTGLSFNWPSPQGPTFGPPLGDGGSAIGYSRDNAVNGNDVSMYMGYMLDGGGIHTIGRSLNTTVSRNFFHDVASGGICGSAPCHSIKSQSTIYIDNWSAGFSINENVVVNTSHTINGWIFFQYFKRKPAWGSAAHDNTARANTICNAGPAPPARDPWDQPMGVNVTGTVNVSHCNSLPAEAAEVVRLAGPRSLHRYDHQRGFPWG